MDPQPTDVMVLGAIKGGAKKFDKIKNQTKIEPEKLNGILERLEELGLIKVETKKGFFGPKVELSLTEKGERELENRVHELEDDWKNMKKIWESGDKQKLQQYMENNKSILPTMFFFGIIDILMFSTMLAFIGAAMTDYMPADQIPEGADGGDSGGEAMDDGGFDIDIGF